MVAQAWAAAIMPAASAVAAAETVVAAIAAVETVAETADGAQKHFEPRG